MEISEEKFKEVKDKADILYKSIVAVKCPYFGNEPVFFSSEGFNHLIYNSNSRERDKNVQYTRFKLLPLAQKLLELTTTHQEYEENLQEFRVKRFKKVVNETKIVKYWGIIAILENKKLKVVIRKVGDNGKLHFWSVIPAWVTNWHRDIKLISTMKGDPGDD